MRGCACAQVRSPSYLVLLSVRLCIFGHQGCLCWIQCMHCRHRGTERMLRRAAIMMATMGWIRMGPVEVQLLLGAMAGASARAAMGALVMALLRGALL